MPKIVALAFDLSDPDQLGEYFSALMKRHKVSLTELAEGVQYSKSVVSTALGGHKQSPRLVRALVEFFHENPDNFFADDRRAK